MERKFVIEEYEGHYRVYHPSFWLEECGSLDEVVSTIRQQEEKAGALPLK